MELEAHVLREGDAYKWDSGKRTIAKYIMRFDNGSSAAGGNIITTSLLFNESSEI